MHAMRLPAWFMKRTRLLEELAIIVCTNDKAAEPLEERYAYSASGAA
jgi:hypothetical protein